MKAQDSEILRDTDQCPRRIMGDRQGQEMGEHVPKY